MTKSEGALHAAVEIVRVVPDSRDVHLWFETMY